MILPSLEPLAVDLDSLVLLPGNPRQGDVDAVAASLARFGQRKPIVVRESDRVIIAGNHTWQAARSLGWSTIAAVLVDDDTATSEAFALADNRTAELGGYDEAALLDLIRSVGEADPVLLLDAGWDADSVQSLVDRVDPGLPDLPPTDDAPEAPVEAFSKPGDVWVLGGHRVACGDSTDVTVYDALMPGMKADLLFTDPPYGMSYDGGRSGNFTMIANDDLRDDGLVQLVAGMLAASYGFRKEGGASYLCFTWRTYAAFEAAILQAGLTPKACIVWDKGHFGLGHSHYRPQHEFIFYCEGQWQGDRAQADVWHVNRDSTSGYRHPTQKPIELVAKALTNSSKCDDFVLDPFGGSGSTLMACEYTGRKARLIELDPRYVDVICRRWQEHTGAQPVLESTGQQHDFTGG